MTSHVLVAIDGSPLSRKALDCALETHPDATITALYVLDPVDSMYEVEEGESPAADQWYDDARELAESAHDRAREQAAEHGVELRTATEAGRPTREIVRYAAEHDVDRIYVGSHGRKGIERLVLGSVAEQVIRNAEVPVTVVR